MPMCIPTSLRNNRGISTRFFLSTRAHREIVCVIIVVALRVLTDVCLQGHRRNIIIILYPPRPSYTPPVNLGIRTIERCQTRGRGQSNRLKHDREAHKSPETCRVNAQYHASSSGSFTENRSITQQNYTYITVDSARCGHIGTRSNIAHVGLLPF